MEWYRALIDSGFPLHVAGISLYPSAGGTTTAQADASFEGVKRSLYRIVTELGVQTFISEYGYPSRLPAAAWSDFRTPLTGYPFTPQGQADHLRDLMLWGLENGVTGIRPWCADLSKGDWDAFAYFDNQPDNNMVYAKPVLDVMKDVLATREP